MGLFMGFILFLVVSLMTHKVDLQSEDYYKKEIQYQDEIQAVKNANALHNPVRITSSPDFVIVQLPDSLHANEIRLDLIRPDDETLDLHFKIEHTKTFLLPIKELKAGKYLTELRYKVKNKPVLQKSEIYITK